jgi:hypothetical protein
MGVESGGIGVVVVDHRQFEEIFDRGPDIKPPPFFAGKVRASFGRDDPVSAGRPRRVEANHPHRLPMHSCTADGEFNGLRHCFNRRFRALQYSARCFYHPVIEKNPFEIEESRVRLGAPNIEAGDHGTSSHNCKNIRIDCRCLASTESTSPRRIRRASNEFSRMVDRKVSGSFDGASTRTFHGVFRGAKDGRRFARGRPGSCSSRHYQPGHAPDLAFLVQLANNDFLGFHAGFRRDMHEQVTCR